MAVRTAHQNAAKLAIHLYFPNGGCFGPKDSELLETIRSERSIIAAGRALGVSYRKCWLRVDALNRTFRWPLVATFPGRSTGGSEITMFGERVVALYLSVQRAVSASGKEPLRELSQCLDWSFTERSEASREAKAV